MKGEYTMVYTHDEACAIVELFEDVLDEAEIMVPDDDRTGDDGEAALYGTTYGNLVDSVEEALIRIVVRLKNGEDAKSYIFSGN